MSDSQRNGVHPFDDALADRWLLSWILPSLEVLKRNLARIAPVALGYGAYVWLLPHLLLAGGGNLAQIINGVQMAAVLAAFMGFGYATLVRGEGMPHGLAQVAPTPGIVQRLALLTLFWLIFWVVLGWILKGLFAALMKSPSAIELGMWLFAKLQWWSIPFLLWLFAPIGFWLATVSALTQIRAIRGEEAVNDIVVDSFRRVFAEPLRIAIPAYILTAVGIIVMYVFAELIFSGFAQLIMRTGWGLSIALAAVSMALALSFWFVIERVYAPELGLEDDVQIGMEDAGEDLSALVAELPLSEQLTQLVGQQGAEAAVRQVANWVRTRQAGLPELSALIQQCGHAELVARELSAVATEWTHSSKTSDLGWLVEQGLTLNPAFMMDVPGQVLALARKLTMLNRSDLATRLLLNMLKQHRAHPDHLPAGLQLARVLATHSNNVDGARKLLGQLAKIYPDEAQVSQVLKQLG